MGYLQGPCESSTKKRGIGSARGNKFKVRPHIKGKQIKSDNIPGVRENRLNDF